MKIRPRKPEDFATIASIVTAVAPEWPVTAAMLEYWEKNRDPKYYNANFVAELDGRMVGVARVGHDSWAFEEGKFILDVQVHPDFRRRGVGSALYQTLLDNIIPVNPVLLQVHASEKRPEGVAFLEHRGYTLTWKRYESRLQTKGFDFSPYASIEEQVRAAGVQIKSLAELMESDPQAPRKLYELDWLLFQDVPMGVQFTKRSFEQWMKEEVDNPHFVKEACLVALDLRRNNLSHDPLSSSYIGYTSLMNHPAGFWSIGMTGVLREYRGKAIAKALKLRGMRYVQAHGEGEIRTFNDPPNMAMLNMNTTLGFQRQPSMLRYQKRLDGKLVEEFDGGKYQSNYPGFQASQNHPYGKTDG